MNATLGPPFGPKRSLPRRHVLALLLASPLAMAACGSLADAEQPTGLNAAGATPSARLTAVPDPGSNTLGNERPPVPIAFLRGHALFVWEPRTATSVRLTEDGMAGRFWWTSDGGALLFEEQHGPSATLQRWRPAPPPVSVPNGLWSPDGTAVALAPPAAGSPTDVESVLVEENGMRRQVPAEAGGATWRALAWSPDSRRLALARLQVVRQALPGAGTPIPQVKTASLWVWDRSADALSSLGALPSPYRAQGMGSIVDVASWSPDGRFLVLGIGPGQPCNSCRADGLPFYAIPAAGGQAVLLEWALQSGAVAWAPGGSWIVLSGPIGRQTYQDKHLTRFDLPAGKRTALTSDPRWSDLEPALSPDGRQIAFARGHTALPGTPVPGQVAPTVAAITSRRLWLIGADGANPRLLTDAAGWTDEAPAWTPDGQWIIFVRWRPQGPGGPAGAGLWAVRPDGSHAQQLVAELGSPERWADGFGFYGQFGWSGLSTVAPHASSNATLPPSVPSIPLTSTPRPAPPIDPEFAPLARSLPKRTRVPVWLPTRAPRQPDAGLRCRHYALLTSTPSSPRADPGYAIALYCAPSPVLPDDPRLYQPGLLSESAHLGDLSGGNAMPQFPLVDRATLPRATVTPLPVAGGLIAQRYTVPDGPASATWTAGTWRYSVLDDFSPAAGSARSQERLTALLTAQVQALAALVRAGPPVAGAVKGWVSSVYGAHDWFIVIWQTAEGFFYRIDWKGNLPAAITLARAMAPSSASAAAE